MSSTHLHRFSGVPGYGERINDIIYCHPRQYLTEKNPDVVVYFGGDVQNFPEIMEACKENKRYMQWNLENIALLLNSFFPNNHIMVIKPSRMQYNTFSCFDNFVPSVGNSGAPNHISSYNALQHLSNLIIAVTDRLQSLNSQLELQLNSKDDSSESRESKTKLVYNLNESQLILIGFSKGCVVLNQFLYEFHHLKMSTDDAAKNIVSRVKEMYWLDGGHSGGQNTWITAEKLLETLASSNIKIHVHVTPYQVRDKKRPWIHDEEKLFCEILHRFGASIDSTLHFEHEPASLLSHFKVLDIVFQNVTKIEK